LDLSFDRLLMMMMNIMHHTTKGTTGSRKTKLYSSQICALI